MRSNTGYGDKPGSFFSVAMRRSLFTLTIVAVLVALSGCDSDATKSTASVASKRVGSAKTVLDPVGLSSAPAGGPARSFDDGDGVAQGIDNCPYVRNRDQSDADGDGRGDRCECGDADSDGFVTSADANLVQRCAVGEFAPNACPFALCDVSGDGICNTLDARLIERFAEGSLQQSDLACAQLAAPTPANMAADSDGDGLSDAEEMVGWTIVVDELGFGADGEGSLLTIIDVQSASLGNDTDGDGLDDLTEFLIRSHPDKTDTDGDALSDEQEWTRWFSSPVSVDTDGDSRGPDANLFPNAFLFDGFELNRDIGYHTSPTLADTDGDGRTDFEEIDDPVFSPLRADLPQYEVTFVGPVDVRLNVEYAESAGQSTEYGTSLATSQTTSTSRGGEDQWSHTSETASTWNISASAEYEFGFLGGTTVGVTVSGGETYTDSETNTHTTSWQEESSQTAQEEYSQFITDSLTKTETASSGSISLGLVVENTGALTFELASLGLSVQQWLPYADPLINPFRTVATLLPAVTGITLAPGESSGVIQVSAQDVNATLIKQFLANPTTLHYETSSLELLAAGGINFDFLNENTYPRTAVVNIDYGDGRLERYRIATNVERGQGGTYEGVTMAEVMQETLGIPVCDPASGLPPRCYRTVSREDPDNPGVFFDVLARVSDADEQFVNQDLVAGWLVFTAPFEDIGEDPQAFDEIRLRPRDEITLVYVKDLDGDGLLSNLEELYGTPDDPPDDGTRCLESSADDPSCDSDGDGRSDFQEATVPLTVMITNRDGSITTYEVYSDPTSADADGDGLNDLEEQGIGTDPALADTDGDDLDDGVEVEQGLPPTNAAPRLYVDALSCRPAGCGDGLGIGWGNAFGELRDAMAAAEQLALNGNPPSEIWVTQGIYKPTADGDRSKSFNLINPVGVYGGFIGGETKRDQRVASIPNFTELSGDLNGNDTSDFSNYGDNSYHVVSVEAPIGQSMVATLDGFTISGGNANDGTFPDDKDDRGGGIRILGGDDSEATLVALRNLQIRRNNADTGGGIYQEYADTTIEDSIVILNEAAGTTTGTGLGGGISSDAAPSLSIDQVLILDNKAVRGGGVDFRGGGQLLIRESVIDSNVIFNNVGNIEGAGVRLDGGSGRFENTVFRDNRQSGGNSLSNGGGVYFNATQEGPNLLIRQCVFDGNVADFGYGLYVWRQSPGAPTQLHVLNTTFGRNHNGGLTGPNGGIWINTDNGPVTTLVENSVFAMNGDGTFAGQIRANFNFFTARNTCIHSIGAPLAGINGNLNSMGDPFVDVDAGDLQLSSNSVCIDGGSNFIDYDPQKPGFQPLPATDLNGNPRIVNGAVDMGAYEVQQ